MKLDHTFIAIRERTTLEIYDLALHVLRDYFLPLMILLFVGALPWIVIDYWLLSWYLTGDYYDNYGSSFSWSIALLICSQAHVGTSMMTHFLGQSMFIGEPSVKASIKALWQVPLSYYWLHFILRNVAPIIFFAWLIKLNAADQEIIPICTFAIVILLLLGLLIRGLRPFVSKIILLEKTPWSAADANTVSFSRRSSSLHAASGSDLFAKFLLSVAISLPLALAVYGLLTTVYSLLSFQWSEGFVELVVIWPISLWLVAGFVAIVRFLSYIDLRIRQEGWEVELRIRAEAAKLEQGFST